MGQTIQRNMKMDEGAGPERASMVRCPHCSQHFYSGGQVESARTPQALRDEHHRNAVEELDEHVAGDIRPVRVLREDPLVGPRLHREQAEPGVRPQNFARGGRVDGSGKVDGLHSHPSECDHLAAGGVCRHLAPSRRRGPGEDYADEGVRNFAEGGEVDSFAGYLAKRRAARGRSSGRRAAMEG